LAPRERAPRLGRGVSAASVVAKIMRPAEVCSTEVTVARTVSPRRARAFSTTTMVPSSR